MSFSSGSLYYLNLNCSGNQLTNLDFLSSRDDAQYIRYVNCSANLFSNLDFTNFRSLYLGLICDNNINLTTLKLKNGADETYNNTFSFANNPNLRFVCQDSFLLNYTQNLVTQYGYTNCLVTTDCSLLSTSDFAMDNHIVLYPNPVKTLLNLEITSSLEITSITISNTLGQLVLAIPDAQKVKTVDVSVLVNGTYFMKINSDKGTVTKKFIKE